MVILVHCSLNDTACNETYVLNLGAKVQSTVLYLLYDIGQTVRTVNVHELGLLVNESLVTLGFEDIPNLGQLVCKADYRT